MPQEDGFKDFRNFLYRIWEHLGLPEPTENQYELAHLLQNGPKRLMFGGFRGVGKSFITSAFCLWTWYWNYDAKIMVVSASGQRAANFSTFCLDLINQVDFLSHLIPKTHQRQSTIKFDIGPCRSDQSPSMKSASISGNITGDRSDLIIPDDVENPKNSATEGMREKIREAVKEFEAVIKPGGRILYLGTPQTIQSLYNELVNRGYKQVLLPARYPNEEYEDVLGDRLMPHIREATKDNPELRGTPTEPTRFPDFELESRAISYGRSGFALQFMLDTRLSDMIRYPLKIDDLIVMNLNEEVGPQKVVWAKSPDLAWDTECYGFDGARFYRPMQVDGGEWLKYTGSILTIDPSGRGKDETTWNILKFLNGYLYLLKVDGDQRGYDEVVLTKIVQDAKRYNVQKVLYESNYGDGMFGSIIKPYFTKAYPCTIEEVKVSGQKEARIIDILEPVMTQHRLVVDLSVIEQDLMVPSNHKEGDFASGFSLMYQLSHLTRDRGSLAHEDRLDALSMAVNYFNEQLTRDADRSIAKRREEALDSELRKFVEDGEGKTFDTNPRWGKSRRQHRLATARI